MRRALPAALLALGLIFTGCMEEPRTRIVLKGFDNSAGAAAVHLTLSEEFFIPSYPSTIELGTTTVSPGGISDVVLLDRSQSAALDSYYIYAFEDTDGSGDAGVNDEFLPVIKVRPGYGADIKLYGLRNSTDMTQGLQPDSRTYLHLNYQFPVDPSPSRPLHFEVRLNAGPTDYTTGSAYTSTVLTHPDAVESLVLLLWPQTYTWFAYLDMDGSGTVSAGDFISEPDPSSVVSGFTTVNGDQDLNLLISGSPW